MIFEASLNICLGKLGRVVDRRRSKQWLLNGFFLWSRDDQHFGNKIYTLRHNEMCTATHAVVAGAWFLMFMLARRLRDVAVRIRKKVAGKHFHCCKEHEEDCGEAERLGPESHLIHDATCGPSMRNLNNSQNLRHQSEHANFTGRSECHSPLFVGRRTG